MVFQAMDEMLHLARLAEEKLSHNSVERHLAEKHLGERVVWVVFIACFGQQEAAGSAYGVLAFEEKRAASGASAREEKIY